MNSPFLDRKIVVGPFQCNCHLLVCSETGDAALVDPGDDAARILDLVKKTESEIGKPLQLKWLLHTHGHLDHIGATSAIKAMYPLAKIAIHEGDEFIYNMLKKQGELFGLKYDEPKSVEHRLNHEEEFHVGRAKFTVVHTPGHSPGSACLRLHESSDIGVKESLFSGDTLFQSSVGRTDLWGADGPQMIRMIRDRILTLDGDTAVHPGHGPSTRVGVEKTSNPFLL